MTDTVRDIAGTRVLVCAPDGPPVLGEREALDLIGAALSEQAAWVALPASRLPDDFFRLSTRLAGELVQKFVNYGRGLAVLGDIARYTADSSTLRAFVDESNRGRQVWFLPGLDDLRLRLSKLEGRARR
jgi:hypothetical protein